MKQFRLLFAGLLAFFVAGSIPDALSRNNLDAAALGKMQRYCKDEIARHIKNLDQTTLNADGKRTLTSMMIGLNPCGAEHREDFRLGYAQDYSKDRLNELGASAFRKDVEESIDASRQAADGTLTDIAQRYETIELSNAAAGIRLAMDLTRGIAADRLLLEMSRRW